MTVAERAAARLREEAGRLEFGGKVAYVYHPLEYAWAPHSAYARAYGGGRKRVLLVGMNPGPWGMGQTGVPFGDVTLVRDWMGVTGEVRAPTTLAPKRPVTGFACTRSEPSGTRLYGWARERFGDAKTFFDAFYVANYCPLLLYDEAGVNLTPPQLSVEDRRAIELVCDSHLAELIEGLRPMYLVGIGAYAKEQAQRVADAIGYKGVVGTVLHPSPASPLANRGWAAEAERQLLVMGALAPDTWGQRE